VFFQKVPERVDGGAELFGRSLERCLALADALVNFGDLHVTQVRARQIQAGQQRDGWVPAHWFVTDLVVLQESTCRVVESGDELGGEVSWKRCHAGAEGVIVNGKGSPAGGQPAYSFK
jgi:hypothetical protein